jgi:quercetin dioxygenase-like cupin family protein
MPYVPSQEALNPTLASLLEIGEDLGQEAWRKAMVGSAACRVVMLHLPPGQEPHPRHRHPHAEEVFIVLRGYGSFSIGDSPDILAGPMSILYAPTDVPHGIRVPGPESLLLLAVVAPNLDVADEALEMED